jgi:small subunit ribosomal protein S1
LINVSGNHARVELGQGIEADCSLKDQPAAKQERTSAAADLSSLSSMLQATWKGGTSAASKPEPVQAGQIRSFKIAALDTAAKKIEVDLV